MGLKEVKHGEVMSLLESRFSFTNNENA